jgi:hypothetical protein
VKKILRPLLVVVTFFLVQCDADFALFPNFLVQITHSVNTADYFSSGSNDFFLYTMQGGTAKQDYVYLGQKLSGGNRRLAIYDGILKKYLFPPDNPSYGSMHCQMNSYDGHLIGSRMYDFNFLQLTDPFPATPPVDALIVNDGTYFYVLYNTDYSGSFTNTYYNYYEFDPFAVPEPAFTPALSLSFPLNGTNDMNKRYILEAARTTSTGNIIIVYRNLDTSEGSFYSRASMAGPFPPVPFPTAGLIPLKGENKIVPGQVQITPEGNIVAETFDGELRLFNTTNGNSYNNIPASGFRGFLVAYAPNDTMYLFNKHTRQLFKSKAWWWNHPSGNN